MSGVDVEKAKIMIEELRVLDAAKKVRTFSGAGERVLADAKELTSITPNQVLPWMIRGTHQLSNAGRKELLSTIAELELLLV